MLFKEVVSVCCDSRAKFMNVLCDGGEEFLNVQR
jgi:hypothetical protein